MDPCIFQVYFISNFYIPYLFASMTKIYRILLKKHLYYPYFAAGNSNWQFRCAGPLPQRIAPRRLRHPSWHAPGAHPGDRPPESIDHDPSGMRTNPFPAWSPGPVGKWGARSCLPAALLSSYFCRCLPWKAWRAKPYAHWPIGYPLPCLAH